MTATTDDFDFEHGAPPFTPDDSTGRDHTMCVVNTRGLT